MVTTRREPIITYKEEANGDELDVEDSTTQGPNRTKKDTDDEGEEECKKPKQKCQRLSSGSAKSKGKEKKTHQPLASFFDTLPLDLVVEIFGHLRPIDLLQLARTNKLVRSYLMQKSSSFVWIAARRKENPSPPDCPPDQSEPQWAHLIYTEDCTVCGRPQTLKVDWILRIRGCEPCLQKSLCTRVEAVKAFCHIKNVDAALELLPYTGTLLDEATMFSSDLEDDGVWADDPASDWKLYLRNNIVKMAETLSEYQTEVDAGVEGAQSKLDAFISRKKEEAAAVVASAPEFEMQMREIWAMKRHLDHLMRELRQSMMKSKLLELGHLEADIDVAIHRAEVFNSSAELTETRWNAVRADAEEAVNDAKALRIEQERALLRGARRRVLRQAYDIFRAFNYTVCKGLLPDTIHPGGVPLIYDLINMDGEDLLSTDDFMPLFPDAIHQWAKTVKTDLLKNVMKEGGPSVSEPPTESELDSLSLAVTTFSCKSFPWQLRKEVIFIDDSVGQHRCWTSRRSSGNPHDCLHFDSWKSKVAAELVVLSGLDPTTATQNDMDNANAQFLCEVCKGDTSEVARDWRNCLTHISEHVHGSDASWTKLDEETTQRIYLIEKAT